MGKLDVHIDAIDGKTSTSQHQNCQIHLVLYFTYLYVCCCCCWRLIGEKEPFYSGNHCMCNHTAIAYILNLRKSLIHTHTPHIWLRWISIPRTFRRIFHLSGCMERRKPFHMQYLVYVVYFSTLANGNVTCRSALSCLEVNHVQFDAFRLALLQLAIRKSYNITILTYNFLYITFPSPDKSVVARAYRSYGDQLAGCLQCDDADIYTAVAYI